MTELEKINTLLDPIDWISNTPLVIEIQKKLSAMGLLDPPPDGKFGAVSTWALSEFAKKLDLAYGNCISPELAKALVETSGIYKFTPYNDLPGKITNAMVQKGYWVCMHPQCYNIVYIEGMSIDGTLNDNAPNKFNDIRALIQIHEGVPLLVDIWDATTAPGRYWTEHPMNPKGAAIIKFGQYKAWSVGIHHAGSSAAHEALVQVDDITVYRDFDKDFEREGKEYTGMFGINNHWGYDYPENDLGRSSAGCLVGRTKEGHREFMALIKKDPRYQASRAYKFMVTIMPASDL